MPSQAWGGEEGNGGPLKVQEERVHCFQGGVKSHVGTVKVVLIMDL